MRLEYKTILQASLLIIVIGIALVISSIILRLLPVLITGPNSQILDLIATGYSFFLIPVFLVLYFWGGMRATRRFKMDAVNAGACTAFAYFLTGIVQLLLEMILGLLFASHVIAGTFVSGATALAAAVFADTAGGAGLLLSSLCGFALALTGTLINFVVGGAGSLFAQR